MRRSRIVRDQRSVLNMDSFDKRRFQEIFELSEGLQRVRDEGQMPSTESLLRDIWSSLYKMKPRISKQDTPDALQPNRRIIENWMKHEQFEKFRESTKLDELLATMCTIAFGKKLNDWITELKGTDKGFERQMDIVMKLQEQLPPSWTDEELEESAVEELNQATEELDELLEFALETSGERFAQGMEDAMDEMIHAKGSLVSLMGGTTSGTGDAELRKIPLREQLAVADKIANDPKMRKIADWAGRFQEIAQKKMKREYTDAMERRSVTVGNDMERLLPAELGMYMHPVAKKEFLRRFAEEQTMQFDQKKRNDLGKGPIIFCLDQSHSMGELENQSKGFVLALLSIAKKQRRDLYVLLFSTEVKRFVYRKGKITSSELARLARTYLGGGTDYSLALKEALNVMEQSDFTKADLLFVTDGEDEVSESFVEEFNARKKIKEFEVLSLVIGEESSATEAFSDRVLHVNGFDDEGSFTAFEL